MNIFKRILFSVLLGCFSFAMSLVLAPVIAVGVILFMTKTGFEIGYKDEPTEVTEACKKLEKNINEELTEHEN